MSDEVPTAIVRTRAEQRRRISLIWAIPLVTAFVAAWLAWDTLAKRGPEITIRFDSAAGLQANQSHIRMRDVDLGVVAKLTLSPHHNHVIVTARMTREAMPLLTDKAQFWVVKPRFFAGSLTGLETLFSGAYIQLEPSGEGGEPMTNFIGLEDPPVLHSSVPGHTFRLTAPRIGSLNPGSPIFFRDLEVGEVLGWDVGQMAKDITIHAFVRAPYDRYVHDRSVFWDASGASVELGGNGLQLKLESLRALVLGGIAFETPDNALDSPVADENHPFVLYADRDAADTASYDHNLRFISYFKSTVAGLSKGAPVTLHGLRIGTVTGVTLSYDPVADEVKAAVRYEVEPDRIVPLHLSSDTNPDKVMLDLVHRGLRIRLESANLITGSKQLALEIVAGAPPAVYDKQGDAYMLAPVDGEQSDIAASAAALLAKLQTIPFQQIGDNLNKTLEGANGTINDPKLHQAIAALTQTLNETQTLMASLNKGADPLLRRLPQIANDLEGTVEHANRLVGSLDDSHGPGSQFGRDLNRMMGQLSDAARSIRILADMLSRHPEALIRGRAEQEVR
ncbi:MAG: MlaD family protein [Acetobacteraceae bacterium]|jgi:paraquat-inducible protein B